MSAHHERAARRGFTLIEAAISCALLAMALFTALSIAQAATRASNRSVAAASRDAAATRRLDLLRRALLRAGASTLVAVPAQASEGADADDGVCATPEPMLDGIAYDNLCYREPVGFRDGETVYEPSPGEEPRRIELVRDEASGRGELVLTDGDRRSVLAGGVIAAAFTRSGDAIEIELTLAEPDGEAANGDGGVHATVRRACVALHSR